MTSMPRGLRRACAVILSASLCLSAVRPALAQVRVAPAGAGAAIPLVPAVGALGAGSGIARAPLLNPGLPGLQAALPALRAPHLLSPAFPSRAARVAPSGLPAPRIGLADSPAPRPERTSRAGRARPRSAVEAAPRTSEVRGTLGSLRSAHQGLTGKAVRSAPARAKPVLDRLFTGGRSLGFEPLPVEAHPQGPRTSPPGLARLASLDAGAAPSELPSPDPSSRKPALRRFWAPLLAAVLLLPGSTAFHELGHYLAARLFGRPAALRIEKTLISDLDSLSYPKQMVVSAAGPAFNFILSGAATAADIVLELDPVLAGVFWAYAGLNAYFGLTNLIPLKASRTGLLRAIGESGATDGWHLREAWRARREAGKGPKGLSVESLLATDKRAGVPAQDYADLDERIDRIQGPAEDIERIRTLTKAVIALESEYAALSARDLRARTGALRRRLKRGEAPVAVLPHAFATMRETMARVLGKRPYVEQVAAGVGVHLGRILEQGTGEGKTLSIGLAAYLDALSGPVDVYTFNPYLSLRDADEIGRVMSYLGLKTGALQGRDEAYLFSDKAGSQRDGYEGNMLRVSRADLYRKADVIYGYSSAFVFDHLYDQDADSAQRHMMKDRAKRFAIVDEADAELLEEANTDFRIVSRRHKGGLDYRYLYNITADWKEGEDFTVDSRSKEVLLTPKSKEFIETLRKVDSHFDDWKHPALYARNALKARHVLRLDKDYAVLKDEVIILDPHTGRLQLGRYWESGLHRFLEIKEGLAPKDDYSLSSHVALDNFMRLYDKVSGLTGTVGTADREFERVYGLKTLRIPPHRPSVRVDHPDRLFRTKEAKLRALVEEAIAVRKQGRPVLIGAKDLDESVWLAAMLAERGEKFSLLNGAQKESEKEIVEKAGRRGALTVATQLAGRGTDISPGPAELALGGLHVLLTAKNTTLRVDLQYRGRGARQGRPGTSRQYVSLEDELILRYATEQELAALKAALGRRTVKGVDLAKEDLVRLLNTVQTRASRAEAAGRDEIRRKDALLEPIRNDYFALRSRLFSPLRPARGRALSGLHKGWGDFVAEYEDLWLERKGVLTEDEVRARYDELVLKPYRRGRRPDRLLKTLLGRPFAGARVLFEGSWYAKIAGRLARTFVKPWSVRWHRVLGKRAAKKDRHEAARKHYERLTSLRPKDAEALFDLAVQRFSLDDYDGAVEDFIGVLYLLWDDKIGYSSRHRSIIGTAIRNLSASFHNRGIERLRADDVLGAAVNFRVAYELAPTSGRREALEEARKALDPAQASLVETLFPFMKYVYLYKARDAVDAKDYKAAERHYSRVLELDPSLATAYFGRAFARNEMDGGKGASGDLFMGLRRKILSSRQFTNMRLVYSKLSSSSLDPALLDKAFAAFTKDYPEGAKEWPRVSQRKREAAYFYRAKGRALLKSEDYYAAAAYFDAAIEADPTFSAAYDDRGVAYYNVGRYRKALEDFADSLKYDMLSREAKYENLIAGHTTRFTWTPDRASFEAFIEELKRL